MSELSLLDEDERGQLLVANNDTAKAFASHLALPDLFEAQAARTPEAVAVLCGATQLTYRELNERSNQLAHFLQREGVGPDVLVALCTDRSADMLVGVLGVLKAGGAYVPIDPTYPADRIAMILEDAKAPLLLLPGRFRESCSLRDGTGPRSSARTRLRPQESKTVRQGSLGASFPD